MQAVSLFSENFRGFLNGFFLIEFDAQHAALVFSVMDDADIFNTDIFQGKDRGHRSNLTGFIRNVNGDGIGGF